MLYGIYALVKALLLVVLSFFVLLGVTKVESQNLKQLGRISAVLLWVFAATITILSLYSSIIGGGYKQKYMMGRKGMKHPKGMMYEGMRGYK